MLKLNFQSSAICHDVGQAFKEVDAICQFKYRGYVISASTAGRSIGACLNNVAVFERDPSKSDGFALASEQGSVAEAIEWVNHRTFPGSFA
jgi:hypothetical protein